MYTDVGLPGITLSTLNRFYLPSQENVIDLFRVESYDLFA